MNDRKIWICIAVLILLALCAACGGADGRFAAPTPAPSETAVPTPAPSPTPVPVVALWGAEDAPAFAEAVADAVRNLGYAFTLLPGGSEETLLSYDDVAAHCVIVCCMEAAPERVRTGDAYYCMLGGADVPPGCHGVRYDGAGATELTLQALLDYPPHCEPVRVMGLFTDEDSAAYQAYQTKCESGALLSRGAYIAEDGKSVEKWLSEKLENVYPGMLDGIFAETGVLADEAADALAALERDDAEIFAASTSGKILSQMVDRPALAVFAAGCSPDAAANICVENAMRLLRGEAAEDGAIGAESYRSGGATAP